MTSKCNGLMGAIFGHNFKPRITKGEPTLRKVTPTIFDDANDISRLVEASKGETYHGDVCSRCGIPNALNQTSSNINKTNSLNTEGV